MKRASGAFFAVLLIAHAIALSPRFAGAQETAAESQKSLDEAVILGPPQGQPVSGAELDARTRSLAERMRCPICQGSSIADSPSSSALTMVAQVRDLLARGYTEQQVLDYFVRSYGEFVLLEPTAEGFNLLVWLLPVAGVLIGAVLIAGRLRQSRKRSADELHSSGASAQAGTSAASALPRGDDAEIDPELARYVERVRSEVGS